MKFYDCTTAPSPRRVRMFIAEKGLSDQIETIEVNLRDAEQLGGAILGKLAELFDDESEMTTAARQAHRRA